MVKPNENHRFCLYVVCRKRNTSGRKKRVMKVSFFFHCFFPTCPNLMPAPTLLGNWSTPVSAAWPAAALPVTPDIPPAAGSAVTQKSCLFRPPHPFHSRSGHPCPGDCAECSCHGPCANLLDSARPPLL